jgi:hypothetical protein
MREGVDDPCFLEPLIGEFTGEGPLELDREEFSDIFFCATNFCAFSRSLAADY